MTDFSAPPPATFTLVISDTPAPERLTLNQSLAYATAAIRGGPANRIDHALDRISETYPRAFRKVLSALLDSDSVPADVCAAIHSAWVSRGFRYRAAIKDDALFVQAFRRTLPAYDGEDLILYRGERAAEFDAGRLGLNWSPKLETARMFASGLCTLYPGGGVLLKASAPAAAVIARPNAHSTHLGEMEHIVEPALLLDVEVIGRFAQTA